MKHSQDRLFYRRKDRIQDLHEWRLQPFLCRKHLYTHPQKQFAKRNLLYIPTQDIHCERLQLRRIFKQ
jgi:hypothetical protein